MTSHELCSAYISSFSIHDAQLLCHVDRCKGVQEHHRDIFNQLLARVRANSTKGASETYIHHAYRLRSVKTKGKRFGFTVTCRVSPSPEATVLCQDICSARGVLSIIQQSSRASHKYHATLTIADVHARILHEAGWGVAHYQNRFEEPIIEMPLPDWFASMRRPKEHDVVATNRRQWAHATSATDSIGVHGELLYQPPQMYLFSCSQQQEEQVVCFEAVLRRRRCCFWYNRDQQCTVIVHIGGPFCAKHMHSVYGVGVAESGFSRVQKKDWALFVTRAEGLPAEWALPFCLSSETAAWPPRMTAAEITDRYGSVAGPYVMECRRSCSDAPEYLDFAIDRTAAACANSSANKAEINAVWRMDKDSRLPVLFTTTPLNASDEILMHYGTHLQKFLDYNHTTHLATIHLTLHDETGV